MPLEIVAFRRRRSSFMKLGQVRVPSQRPLYQHLVSRQPRGFSPGFDEAQVLPSRFNGFNPSRRETLERVTTHHVRLCSSG